MTVAPDLATKVEAAWPEISKALTTGLKETKGEELSTLVTIVDRSSDLSSRVRLGWSDPEPAGALEYRALKATVGTVGELRGRFRLLRSDLDPRLNEDTVIELTDWAKEVRKGERRWVLAQINDKAEQKETFNRRTLRQVEPGWRLVSFSVVEGLKEACAQRDVEFIPCKASDAPGVKVLVYAQAQFSVARLEDLTPRFEYGDDGIDVFLTERVELFGFDDDAPALKYSTVGTFPASD